MRLSKRNRRGVLWLAFIMLAIMFVPRFLGALRPTPKVSFSFEELKKIKQEIVLQKRQEQSKNSHKQKKVYRIPSSKFNPNDLSKKDWMEMGLSEKQVNVILKFSQKGLRSNKDLEKIYVMPKELFNLLKDSTIFDVPIAEKVNSSVESRNETIEIQVELNLANEAKLMEIPGIGPFYAKKIIEEREKLGGFIHETQLLNIWKFDEKKLEDIRSYILIDTNLVKKIDLNTASFYDFYNHPYFSKEVANSIVKMRKQKPFESINDVKKSMLINDELFQIIKPYLLIK